MRITESQLRKVISALLRENAGMQLQTEADFAKLGILPLEYFDFEDDLRSLSVRRGRGEKKGMVMSSSEPGSFNMNNGCLVVRSYEDKIYILSPWLFEACSLSAMTADVSDAYDVLEASGFRELAGMHVPFSQSIEEPSEDYCKFVNWLCKSRGVRVYKDLGWSPVRR